MHATDVFATRQVGDGAGYAQDAGVAAGGHAHGACGLGQKLSARFVGGGDGFEEIAVDFGIGADGVVGVTRGLDRAGGGDAGGDLFRPFGGGWQDEIGGGDGVDVYVQVDPVEQWPRYLRLIIRCTARRAGAGQSGVAQMAAAAGVHRGDKLNAGGERDVRVGAGDADSAGFERLAQRIEDSALKFGEFVKEQHAQMREADFAGFDAQAAADERRHRGAMMRRAEGARAADPSAVERTGDAGDHRDFERFGRAEFGQDAGQATGHQRFACAGGTGHQPI